jgi:hypothetical protein
VASGEGSRTLADCPHLILDDGAQAHVVAQDRLEFGDGLAQLRQLGVEIGTAESREAAEWHVEDVLGLLVAELERLGAQRRASCGLVFGGADRGDDRIDHVDRLEQALHDVGALRGLREPVLGPAADHLTLMLHVVAQGVAQPERARHAVDERNEVHGEARLHRRVLEQVVQDDEGRRVALEVEHQPGSGLLRRLVADVANALDLACRHEFGGLDRDRVDRRLVRDLGDDDLLAARPVDDLGLGADLHRAAPGAVGRQDARTTHDLAARREVGALHELHQLLDRGLGVIEQMERRVDDLAEVVRRDVGGHADGDALAAVDQQVRETARQHGRFVLRRVEVADHVDGVLVDTGEHVGGERRQAALGVAVRGRRVGGRAEVAVLVDEHVAQREVLAHPYERVVDRLIAVGVVLADHVADDGCALAMWAVGAKARLVHRPQDPAVHRLEAVAHVRQRPRHDDRHGVVEERLLHLGLDFDWLHPWLAGCRTVGNRGVVAHRLRLRCRGIARRVRWSE